MSIITRESGICLSERGTTVYPACAEAIVREGKEQYIQTENLKNIETDESCARPPIVSFSCSIGERIVVDSGKSIEISNTCSLPLTITGFINSDPQRFSIFEYPNYVGLGVYESGNVNELPIRIDPYQKVEIKTFFHPLYTELETGTPGTFDVRDGDKFGAKFSIYPGFPVLNCTDSETECDAFFTLTGEFICDDMDLPKFLGDQSRYAQPEVAELATIENAYCIPRLPIGEDTLWAHPENELPYVANTVANTYSGLSGASLLAAGQLENFLLTPPQSSMKESFVDSYLWATGAIGGLLRAVTGVISDGDDTSMENLINYNFSNHEVNYSFDGAIKKMFVSYAGPNYITINTLEPMTMTGLRFTISGEGSAQNARNGLVFFDRVINPGQERTRLFLSESGNLSEEDLCGWST